MSIAKTVESCLDRYALRYCVISHPRSMSSRDTAQTATIPAHAIAKAVVLNDGQGDLMAVVPGDSHVDVAELSRKLGRHLHLVEEMRLAYLFKDCELGAVPPIGFAYGMETIIDDRLLDLPEICFVAGDHNKLVCIKRDDFLLLVSGARHGKLSRAASA